MTAKGGHACQPAGQMDADPRAILPTCCGCHLIPEHQGLRIRGRNEAVTPTQPNAPSCLLQGPHSQSPGGQPRHSPGSCHSKRDQEGQSAGLHL